MALPLRVMLGAYLAAETSNPGCPWGGMHGDEQLALMTQAALRAPDHAELVPYRFKLVRGAAKEGMAAQMRQDAEK